MEPKKFIFPFLIISVLLFPFCISINPLFPSWYADPEAAIFNSRYFIYPTYSANYDLQTFFDAFSSTDLKSWTKHTSILIKSQVSWVTRAMWAPSVIEKDGKYYLFFGANDVHEGEVGGIGVAVSDNPEGPFRDAIGAPLIQDIVNGAQPIDQFVFKDDSTDPATYYMFYGGWSRCNVVKLNSSLTGLLPLDEEGNYFKEVTPEGYVEGPFMLKRNDIYYFMWSEGGWGGPDYRVAYARSDNPLGPWFREKVILEQDPNIATGGGHHSVISVPGKDEYFIVYHRRPLGEVGANHRVVCIDEMKFDNETGEILKVQMTFEGVIGPLE